MPIMTKPAVARTMSLDKADKGVDVHVDQSAFADQTCTVTSSGDLLVRSLFLEKTKISQTADIDIRADADTAGGDITGALVDVTQTVEADQSMKVMVKVREKGDTVIVKAIVIEKTVIDQETDVDVLLTDDGIFDVREIQTSHVTQDRDVKVSIKGDIDIDLALSQVADIDQDLDVVFSGTPTDFTITIDPDQDAHLTQHVGIDLSPSGTDLLLS